MGNTGDMPIHSRSVNHAEWEKDFYQLQRTHPDTSHPIFRDVTNNAFSGWKFLLPIGKSTRILYLGCGWGSILFSLARSSKDVVALDSNQERLKFLRSVSAFLGLENIRYIHAKKDFSLPFQKHSFDIVVVFEDFEMVPVCSPGLPLEVHLNFMKEIVRVLSQKGVAFLVVKNRMAYSSLLDREDASDLLLASLMPRKISGIYSKLLKGKPYRAFTYTGTGYRRLFQNGGMRSMHFFASLLDWDNSNQLIDLEDRAKMITPMIQRTNWKEKIKSNVFFLRNFGKSFSVLMSPVGKIPEGFVNHLIKELNKRLNLDGLQCAGYFPRDSGVQLFLTNSSEEICVVRLPLDEKNVLRVKENCRSLRFLENIQWPADYKGMRFPKLLFEGSIEEQFVCVESWIPGSHLNIFPNYSRQNFKFFELMKFLIAFAKVNKDNCFSSSDKGFISEIPEIREAVRNKLIDDSLKKTVDDIFYLFHERVSLWVYPNVLVHGDFHAGNCTWDLENEKLLGVVDWDQMIVDGLPGWDLLNLLCIIRRQQKGLWWGESLAKLIDEKWETEEEEIWKIYNQEVGVGVDDRNLILVGIWLKGLWQGTRGNWQHLDYKWLEGNVAAVIKSFQGVFR